MSKKTNIYVNQNINGKPIELALLLNSVKQCLNDIVDASYKNNNISDYEKQNSIPLIRNNAKVNGFSYNPVIVGDKSHNSLIAKFCVFTDTISDYSVSRREFESSKRVPNQEKVLHCFTDDNYDAINALGKEKVNSNDNYMILSTGSDKIGLNVMKILSKRLKSDFNVDVFLKPSDSNDEVIEIKKESVSNKNNNRKKMR